MIVWPGANRASCDGLTSDGAAVVVVDGAFTLSVALRVTPLYAAVTDTFVVVLTADVVAVNRTLVVPAATVTLDGTLTTAFALVSDTTAPPLGAVALNVTVPCDDVPPVTLVGLNVSEESAAGEGGGGCVVDACGSTRRTDDQLPATPAEFTPRTRHHSRRDGSDPIVTCDAVTL